MMLDLSTLTLSRGIHDTREEGVCLLEAAAWWGGEDHSDHPRCVSPVLATYGRKLNDALDDAQRQRLVPLVPRLVGTAGDGHDEARAWLATDWLVRTCAPAWLRLIDRDDLADALEAVAPVISAEAARNAQPILYEARSEATRTWTAARAAAREAAWAAVWAAARDAARDAARAAARDAALDAAGVVARDPARAAAGEAAWDVARAAGVGAAWDAAWEAAWDDAGAAAGVVAREAAAARLRSTARALQEGAFDLFDRMIDPQEVRA